MDNASFDSSLAGPVIVFNPKRSYRRLFCFFIFIAIGALTSIFTFGANTTLIKSSTAVLKIDTRKATVHDILGGIEFLPIRSSTTYTTRATSTTNTIRATSTTRSRTSTATRSRTSTQITSVATSYYLDAKSSLENLTEILGGIGSYVTVDDFSLARVFRIHDHLYLANGGFKCWSDYISRDYMYDVSAVSDSCSSNGFFQCFSGKTSVKSESRSSAYNYINTDYLSKTTSFNKTEYEHISDLWSNVLRAANSSTLTLNINSQGYKAMGKLLCVDDYFRSDSSGGRKHLSIPFILGLTSFLLTIVMLLFPWHILAIRTALVLWLLSFGLDIAMFAVLFNSNIPAAKYINQTEGITAKSGQGLIGYFVGLMILNLVALLLLVIELREQIQEYHEDEREPLNYNLLNDIPLNNLPPNPPPELPPSYDNIIHKPEQEPLNKVVKHEIF